MNPFPPGSSRRKTAVILGEVRHGRAEVGHIVVLVLLVLLTALGSEASAADEPSILLHSLFDPGTNAQPQARLGASVALDGNIAVIGAPDADVEESDAGVVKVYDTASGALLYTLANPSPAAYEHFGRAVAVSGRRVVIGAPTDNLSGLQAGGAYVYDLDGATPTLPIVTLTNPSPAALDAFGNSVAIAGTRVVVGAPSGDIGVLDKGSAYVYDLTSVTPFYPTTVLTNPSPAASDRFGFSVAISGTRVVVGTPWDSTVVSNAGSAYVYDLLSATPNLPIATLSNPNPTTNGYFGYSVAMSGTRIAVGTYEFNAGRAYIYDVSRPTPTVPLFTLANPSPAVADYFGSSVAISGTRVVVGAYLDDTGANDSGSVYGYDLSSATPTVPVISLANPSPGMSDWFGVAAAISGTRVVVGAPNDDTGAFDAGSAYVFDLAGAAPAVPVFTINSHILSGYDLFGFSVAISGTWAVVGAYADDAGATDAGTVYVYDLASATPTIPVLTLTNPSPAQSDYFGTSVAISGTRVVIGANLDDAGTNDSGSAYVFDLLSAIPGVPVATLTNPSPGRYDSFGYSVAISGQRVVVGAYGDDSDAGSAYVYDLLSGSPATPMLTLTNPVPTRDSFGAAVAISGTRVVIAAWDKSGTEDGSVYVFDLLEATPTRPVITLTNPSPAQSDFFGTSVGISGRWVVVGAESDDTGAINAGSAYVYDLASLVPFVPVLTLTNPSPKESSSFGCSVSIADTRVVIGAFGDRGYPPQTVGNAYVYDLNSATPAVPIAELNNPGQARGDRYGWSVAIDGTTVVTGAPFDDTNAKDRGAAYVFSVGPLLRVTPTAPGLAMISWTPTNSPGYVLQYSERLAPTNWLNTPSGAANPVAVSTTNASRFYRMFKP